MAVLTTIYDVESNIDTTLYQSISTTATSGLIINTELTITKGVLSFETNGQIEYISFGSTSVSGGRTTLGDVRRNLTKTLNDFSQISATGLQHTSGVTKVKLVNYHALYNLKAGTSQANIFTANQTISGTNKLFLNDSDSWVYDDGTDIRFKSSTQAEVTLSQLAGAAGINDKVKISATDTTEGYLDAKLTAGDGLSITKINGGGNESYDLDIDLADTTIFKDARTGNEARVVVTKSADGKIDSTFIPAITASNVGTTGTANTTFSSGDALSYDGASRLVKADGNDLVPFGMYAGIATAGGTAGGATTFCVNGVVTVPAFSLAERVNCASSLGEYNTTTNITTDAISSTNVWRAQTFIPQAGQDNVYQVTIAITDSSLVGTMVAQIYATSGTAPNAIPTGAALGTSANVTVFGSSVTFTFTTPIAVTPLTAYAIVVKLTARTSGSFAWNYNITSVYANGNSATSPDSGVSWTPETTYDRYFQVTFKGLAGSPVFLSDTAGALSLIPGTYPAKIGRAIDSTHILLDTPLKTISGTVSGSMPSCSGSTSGTVSASVTSTISVGGRPLYVWYHMYGGSSATNPMKLGVWGVNGRECCHYESTANSYIATSGNTCYGNDAFSNTYNSSVYFSNFGPDSITFARAVSTTKGGSTTSPAVTGGSFTLIFVAIIL